MRQPGEEGPLVCVWCGDVVDLPQAGYDATRDNAYCTLHHSIATRDPRDIGTSALIDAEELLATPASSLIRWPWRTLNHLCGPIVPGRLTYIAAFSGFGKTTVVSHLVHYWLSQGLRVSLLPLEADPLEVMCRLGCLELGINADDALSLRLRERADAGDVHALNQIHDLTRWMRAKRKDEDFLSQLRIEPLAALTPAKFTKAVNAAAVMESDILIVDHVDEVEGEANDHTPEIQLSNQIQSAALTLAKQHKIPAILTTQFNSSRTGGDPLAYYRPPNVDWIYNKGKKIMKAATIVATYWPMITSADKDDKRNAAEGGDISRLLKRHTMGFAALKRRYGGVGPNTTAELHYEHGRLTDQDGPDLLESQADRHRIPTGPQRHLGGGR